MGKPNRRGKRRSDTATIVAELKGVTPRYVRMIRNGERENEEILATLIDLEQGQSKLIKELTRIVPIKPIKRCA
jgi:hypothetical protein